MGKDQIQKRELEVRKTENKCNDEASASWVLELKQTERKKKVSYTIWFLMTTSCESVWTEEASFFEWVYQDT